LEDDTVAIREPPIRNSGVMGGNFLRRQVVKKPDGSRYAAKDMFVGNVVDFVSHRFELQHADENTYRLMENDEKSFPYSNFSLLHDMLAKKEAEIRKYFVTCYEGDGMIDIDEFTTCCDKIGLRLNKQQILTLWRKLDKKGKDKISFTKVIKMASVDLLNAHVG